MHEFHSRLQYKGENAFPEANQKYEEKKKKAADAKGRNLWGTRRFCSVPLYPLVYSKGLNRYILKMVSNPPNQTRMHWHCHAKLPNGGAG